MRGIQYPGFQQMVRTLKGEALRSAMTIELEAQVHKCENDIRTVKKHSDVEHWDEATTLITSDYLLLSKKFEEYVDPDFYKACIQRMQGIHPRTINGSKFSHPHKTPHLNG